jgi:hypothetical protein
MGPNLGDGVAWTLYTSPYPYILALTLYTSPNPWDPWSAPP